MITLESRLQEIYLLIAREQYHFLKNILEGYDSLCCLSAKDMKRGLIRLRYPAETERELFKLLNYLAPQINGRKTSKQL